MLLSLTDNSILTMRLYVTQLHSLVL